MSPANRELEAELVYRMELGEPAWSPEEAEARELYERLIAHIRNLEWIEAPIGWEERFVERWRRERKR